MKIVYFYAKDGKKIGPLSREQLDDLHLDPNTLVWHYGLSGWIPYKDLSKQAINETKESLFDKFFIWSKSKKKVVETATPTTSVVEKPIEQVAEKKEVVSEPITQKSEEKSEKRKKPRRVLKIIPIGLLILIAIGGVVYCGYYYKNTYLPEKRLNEACADLETKWVEAVDQEKVDMALKIVTKDTSWGYDNVPDSDIQSKFGAPKRNAALKVIEDDAFNGNAESQFILGQIYYCGDQYYVSSDYAKAAYWWNEAANNGNMKAMNNLGCAYQNGVGVQINMQNAINCFKIAAAADMDKALVNLGDLYETGVSVENGYHYEQYQTFSSSPRDPGDIFVRSGWRDYEHYNIYNHKVPNFKVILPKDIQKAQECWRKAAALGNEDAKVKLQKIYE